MFIQIKLHDMVVDMFLHSMMAFVKNNQINTFKLDKGISITIEVVQLDRFLFCTSKSCLRDFRMQFRPARNDLPVTSHRLFRDKMYTLIRVKIILE